MSRFATVSLIIVALAAWLGFMSMFVVTEREVAIKFRLGEFVEAYTEPGLYFKYPFVNNVRKFDARILTLDMKPERYLTSEMKNVIVDAFVKWRIADVRAFYRTTGGDERRADERLSRLVGQSLRNQFGQYTISQAVSEKRAEIMDAVAAPFAEQAKNFGVEVIDVRVKRVELTPEVSESVFRRMRADRNRVAAKLRAEGEKVAQEIEARAEKERTVTLSQAFRTAEAVRGEGDAEATEIYAGAYGKNEEFYQLYRSLGAYRNVFGSKDDILVVDPKSEFFRYFQDAGGGR